MIIRDGPYLFERKQTQIFVGREYYHMLDSTVTGVFLFEVSASTAIFVALFNRFTTG